MALACLPVGRSSLGQVSALADARPADGTVAPVILSPGPIPRPENWLEWVNQPQSDEELAALRRSVNRGTPLGSEDWSRRIADQLGLEYTLRPRGRPRKEPEK